MALFPHRSVRHYYKTPNYLFIFKKHTSSLSYHHHHHSHQKLKIYRHSSEEIKSKRSFPIEHLICFNCSISIHICQMTTAATLLYQQSFVRLLCLLFCGLYSCNIRCYAICNPPIFCVIVTFFH